MSDGLPDDQRPENESQSESASNQTRKPKIIRELGDYNLVKTLGEGGMGAIYLAVHKRLQKKVALKVLPRATANNSHAIARFQREMVAVGRLQHPNIIQALDAREENDIQFLVLEYADGLDLAKISLDIGPIKTANACEMIRQSAVGLQYVLENGMVHRDIKPSNLLLTTDGVVKILDLGLALLDDIGISGEGLTVSGQVMGTLDFMSPEQADDTRAVDIRSDIYSLGCSLFNLLVGHPPFVGEKYSTAYRKIGAHMNRPLPDISEERDDVPVELLDIVRKMTAKSAEERYATPDQVAEALQPFCEGHNLSELLEKAKQKISDRIATTETVILPPADALPTDEQTVAPFAPTEVVQKIDTATDQRPLRLPRIALALSGVAIFFGAIMFMMIDNDRDVERELPKNAKARPTGDSQRDLTKNPPLRELLTSDDWRWTEPVNLGVSINSQANEDDPRLSSDGQRLYFRRGLGSDQICVSERATINDDWSMATPMEPTIEFDGPFADMFISRDEKTLVFVNWNSETKGASKFLVRNEHQLATSGRCPR